MGEAKKRRGFEAAVMERRLRRARLSERARLATVGFGVVAADDSGRFPKIIGSGVAVARQGVVLTARHVVLDLEAVVLKERLLKRSAVSVVVVSALPRHSQASDEGGEPEDPNAAPREGDPVATCGWPYGAELYPDGPRFSSFQPGEQRRRRVRPGHGRCVRGCERPIGGWGNTHRPLHRDPSLPCRATGGPSGGRVGNGVALETRTR